MNRKLFTLCLSLSLARQLGLSEVSDFTITSLESRAILRYHHYLYYAMLRNNKISCESEREWVHVGTHNRALKKVSQVFRICVES